jgi:hypothetical protein
MPTVHLGNPAAVDRGQPLGKQVTVAHIPDSYTLTEQVQTVAHDSGGPLLGLWRVHSTAAAPAWVESDSPELARALADHYGCPIGRPDDWETA